MTEYVRSSRLADREIVSNLPRNMSTFLHSSEWISLPKVERIFNVRFVLRQVLRLPKRVLQTVRSSVSCFEFQYISLKSSSSRLRLLPLLLVPSIFLSITCLIRQFLRKMSQIQLVFFVFIACRCSFPPSPYEY